MNNYADFSWYRGEVSWLKERAIFLAMRGSHAYGTNTPESDVDLIGISIPPKEYYLGNLKRFAQAENKGGIDAVVYGINKFFDLAADCNPNIIEVLFTDEAHWILPDPNTDRWRFSGWRTPWGRIMEKRHLFVSQKAKHTFSGYAVSQLHRIETHRAWLLNPIKAQPQRSDFDLPKNDTTLGKETLAAVNARVNKLADAVGGLGFTKDQVEKREAELVEQATNEAGIGKSMIQVIVNERRYAAAMRNWKAYQEWKLGRNAKRAELEAKFGYDTKHAMHLVRLLTMAEEILSTGRVIVKRPDAEFLLSVRNGAIPFDDLVEWARWKEATLELIKTRLPYEPDRPAIDRLLMEVVEEVNFR